MVSDLGGVEMKKDRVIGYDLIRVISAIMVVAIHSNVYYLQIEKGSINWILIMELTAMCVVSVPLFFMVSGAVNLGKAQAITIRELYKRKLPIQFVPFLMWSFIYIIARMIMGKIPVSLKSVFSLIWEPAYYQFWFMYTLLGLYLCIPIFQFIIQNSDKKLLQYIVFFWIITSIIIPMAVKYIPGMNWSSHLEFDFLEGYWGYFFLGGYLRKYPLKESKKWGSIFIFVGILMTGIGSLLEWFCLDGNQYYGYVYSSYLLPGAVLASVGVFMTLSDIQLKGKFRKLVAHFSGFTMGIYYVHMLIVEVFDSVLSLIHI